MKKKLLIFLMSFICIYNYSQDNYIYNKLKSSIIYLEHVVHIDKNLSEHPELFERIEERAEKKILNKYLTLQSGSGFIITNDGHALTNKHVIRFKNIDFVKIDIAYNYAKSMLKEYGSDFTTEEKDYFIDDLINIVKKTEYKFIAFLGEKEYQVDILTVTDDDGDDLGLIKLRTEDSLTPVKLVQSKEISESIIGKEVYSFGYPLGSTMDYIFEERVVTMNNGNISAYRQDELGIQHNAAISSGNSGGPLIDDKNQVIGINTASITEGNSLYYSIAADKIRSFLKDSGYGNILKWNEREGGAGLSSNINYNILGEIESSSDLLVYAEEGANVYIDGSFKGKSPLYYTLTKPLTDIKIEKSNIEFEGKIRLLTSLKETTNLIPNMKQSTTKILFESDNNDDEITVYADGKLLGKTPLNYGLIQGTYDVKFTSDNNIYKRVTLDVTTDEKTIIAEKIETFKIGISGLEVEQLGKSEKEHKIVRGFENNISRSDLIIKNDMHSFTYELGENINLPKGDYSLTIEGIPGYENSDIPISIYQNETFNIKDLAGMGSLTIKGLPKDSVLLSNNIKYTINTDDTVKLPIGVNNIYIWRNGKKPFETDITVRADDSAFITYEDKIGHDIKAISWLSTSVILAGGGIATRYLIDYEKYALDNSDSYSEYEEMTQNFGIICSSIVVGGIVALVPTVVEYFKYKNQKRTYKSLVESANEKK